MHTNIYNVSNLNQNLQTMDSLQKNNSNLSSVISNNLITISSESNIFQDEKLKIIKYLNTDNKIQEREERYKQAAEKFKAEEKEEEVYTSPLQETSYNSCKKISNNFLI